MGRRLAGRSRVRSIPCANGGVAGVEVSSTLSHAELLCACGKFLEDRRTKQDLPFSRGKTRRAFEIGLSLFAGENRVFHHISPF